jgi:hypothetical protein
MSMSMRWLGPGPTLAVTMTSVGGWAVFHMHFSVASLAGGRANLIAVEKEEEEKEEGGGEHGSA